MESLASTTRSARSSTEAKRTGLVHSFHPSPCQIEVLISVHCGSGRGAASCRWPGEERLHLGPAERHVLPRRKRCAHKSQRRKFMSAILTIVHCLQATTTTLPRRCTGTPTRSSGTHRTSRRASSFRSPRQTRRLLAPMQPPQKRKRRQFPRRRRECR